MVIADAKCATALGRVAATVLYLSYQVCGDSKVRTMKGLHSYQCIKDISTSNLREVASRILFALTLRTFTLGKRRSYHDNSIKAGPVTSRIYETNSWKKRLKGSFLEIMVLNNMTL